MIHANGDIYEGEWYNDKARGKGSYINRADKTTYSLPSVFTFREKADFKEDHLYRDIEPTVSYQLDMLRHQYCERITEYHH